MTARRAPVVFRAIATMVALALVARGVASAQRSPSTIVWTAAERDAIESLWIGNARRPPRDPSNRYADDPRAFALGQALFFDPRLSGKGNLSCANCHLPGHSFQDDLPLGHGVGTTARRTMPIAGAAFSRWFFWDGRADSQWAQALGPLESAVEQNGTRTLYVRVIADEYRKRYVEVFGALPSPLVAYPLPASAGPGGTPTERDAWLSMTDDVQDAVNRVFANIGKAIAAFERGIAYAPSRFDVYASQLAQSASRGGPRATLSVDELAGLRLFIGKAQCIRCHNGPLFSDSQFHNVGIGGLIDGKADSGRVVGIRQALASEFNCLGRYSDAKPSECVALTSAVRNGDAVVQAFRTPSLRNVTRRPPYAHTGEFATISAVLDHHDRAPAAQAGHSELSPLGLSTHERALLEAFLRTLEGRTVIAAPTGAQGPATSPGGEISAREVEKGAQHQAAADEQDKRKRNFSDGDGGAKSFRRAK